MLAHRGPDGAGIWCEGGMELGHRLLWSTEESRHEHLPMASANGDLILTADARIDNREDLIHTLAVKDPPGESISDSSLILAAYERSGTRCPERLLGDFAFVLSDRPRQTLFCARDHFGVKPLYYHYHPGRLFACASEIKALFCLPEVGRHLNEVQVADYLAGMSEDKTSTFYRDIVRLPPAQSLTIDGQGMRLYRYWALDPSAELRLESDEDATRRPGATSSSKRCGVAALGLPDRLASQWWLGFLGGDVCGSPTLGSEQFAAITHILQCLRGRSGV